MSVMVTMMVTDARHHTTAHHTTPSPCASFIHYGSPASCLCAVVLRYMKARNIRDLRQAHQDEDERDRARVVSACTLYVTPVSLVCVLLELCSTQEDTTLFLCHQVIHHKRHFASPDLLK